MLNRFEEDRVVDCAQSAPASVGTATCKAYDPNLPAAGSIIVVRSLNCSKDKSYKS
ncbi:hypothetical protein HDF15_004597 [Granulicella mallensis]|uniref:Uncharacterized protein n=1 Tax=Granulicella mallensis TaxID=940614 RepID=A0A7W7ZVW5_9BACT|nr:hypothetical protein [Granulicella mallensis]